MITLNLAYSTIFSFTPHKFSNFSENCSNPFLTIQFLHPRVFKMLHFQMKTSFEGIIFSFKNSFEEQQINFEGMLPD